MKAVVLLIMAVMVGCGTMDPKESEKAYDTAYANLCKKGVDAPVRPWEFHKQSEDFKNAYALHSMNIHCGNTVAQL